MRTLCILPCILTIASATYNDSLTDLISFSWKLLDTTADFVPLHPDSRRTVPQLLARYGYPFESHDVTTEDGYILTLHRIPFGRYERLQDRYRINRPAVLLKHCFMCSSKEFLLLGPERSLAYLLADQGYDVWLPNSRGNTYSMRHETLRPTDPKFWDFSFHEKGYYDLPACIDHILNITGRTKLTYIGYSQGTTEGMVLTSTKPKYNDKINVMIFLSPIGYMKNIRSPLVRLVHQYQSEIANLARQLEIYGIPWNRWLSKLAEIMCNDVSPIQNICISILQLIVGFDIPQIKRSLLTVLLSTTPSGFSIKELVHFGQEISSGRFQQYDYGEKNIQIYGAPVPPAYDVSKITCPVAAYYGSNDFLASVEDVEKLLDEFPNKPERRRIPYELFNHIDFVFAKDVKVLIYDSVIDVCKKYNSFFNLLK